MYGYDYGYGLGEALHTQNLGGYGDMIEALNNQGITETLKESSEPPTDYFLWGFAGVIITLNTLGWGYICWRTRKYSAPKSPLKRGTMWTECIALERH
jgi:hypothetical protein